MGTMLAIMGGYYLLSGQVFRAAKEVVDWVQEKMPKPDDE